MTHDDRDAERTQRRLRWRSRRGALELELALAPFLETRLATMSARERACYERLLEHDDWDIFDWIQGRGGPGDPELVAIIDEIRRAGRR